MNERRGENWGRWGADDERGAANLLTPEVVRDAVASLREGRVITLSMPINGATSNGSGRRVPHMAGRPLPQHYMAMDGGDYAAGARKMEGGISLADDAIVISPHGTTTHIDALSHMWRDDVLYNGHPADRVRSYGATRCGIDKLGAIVTRGVFFDIPALLGVPFLDQSTAVDAEMLEACAARSGVTPRPGDVALVRTGWPLMWAEDPAAYQAAQPGLSYDGAAWLVERDVVAIGSDNVSVGRLVPHATSDEGPDRDVHMLTLWRHGVHLIELLWLEELAAADRAEFLFMLAPLAIEGGTASPVSPVAVL